MNYEETTTRVYTRFTLEPFGYFLNGDKVYLKDGKPHRLDGPAVELANGTKFWYQDGQMHYRNGPAVESVDGTKRWYIHGTEMTEEEFNNRQKSCNGKIVEIDGKKYKLTEVS